MPINPSPIATRRYKRMVERMRDAWIAAHEGRGHGWKADVARELGVTGQYVGYIESGERDAGIDAIDLAISRMGIAGEYFHSTRLGPDPDHADHMSGAQTQVVAEELPGLTDYEREFGRLEERHRRSILGLARDEGPDALTIDVIDRHMGTLRAIDRGKKIGRPRDAENVVDVDRGQRAAKKKLKPRG